MTTSETLIGFAKQGLISNLNNCFYCIMTTCFNFLFTSLIICRVVYDCDIVARQCISLM